MHFFTKSINKTFFLCLLIVSLGFSKANATVTASFTFSNPGAAPATVQFTNTSSSTSGQIVSHVWQFGDGSTSVAVNPSHTYFYAGTYSVSLKVTDNAGDSSMVTMALMVTAPQQTVTPQYASTMGREFWVGYGHHQFMEATSNTQDMVLHLSTGAQGATVIVSIDSSGNTPATGYKRTYIIHPNSTISTENLPKGITSSTGSATDPNYDSRLFSDPPPIGTGSEGVFRKKGIHVESTAPISVQAHIHGGVSAGMTTLFPVNTWGYTYKSMNSEQRDADRSYSWIYVIAKEDNTAISIKPSAPSRLGKPAHTPFTITLHKGQIYQLLSQVDQSQTSYTGGNFTGTDIKSLPGPDGKYHPIAVFAGSSRTGGETLTCGTGSGRDNDIQQLMPVNNWGTEYLTAPVSKSTGSTLSPTTFQTAVYKVMVKDPTTVVARNGAMLSSLIASNYYIFSSNTADRIYSDKPIMVGQFLSGTANCNGGNGDPDMVYLTPINQGANSSIFGRTNRQAISTNYLTLVVPTAALGSLKIDSSNVFNHTYPHPNKPGYTVVVKGWLAGSAVHTRVSCDSAYTAICYGLGAAESYAFNVSTRIKIADSVRKTMCPINGSLVLNSELSGTTFRWEMSTDGSTFTGINDNAYFSGSSTNALQLNNLPASWYGYRYRCIADGEVGLTYTVTFSNQWIGGTGNAWENGANWICGSVPAYTSDVIIPAGANVVLSSNVTVRSLTVDPGATFTVTPGYNITITN